MTSPEIAPLHEDLTFHGPLSEERAARLIRSLMPLDDAHVLDLGCGWAEFLLRTLEAAPTATGTGVDRNATDIACAQANADARGLSGRVSLQVADVAEWHPARPADVVIVNGASQVWGGDPLQHTANALTEARKLLAPRGRLLLGEGFWEREPTEAQLAAMPVPRDQYGSLADLVDLAHRHGYRMLAVEQASLDEWDVFENGHGLAWERWLRDNPGSEHVAEIRAKADNARHYRLRGWRETMGLAYLTLQAP
ncbi:Methyltransferase domain-containing protein [Lentzea albidocapillata subsp. violacea]|uniref:Methyltransferase domain-containing protein n=1 Tax=Lentzea albidocapillata subsp. violacea TaxID=128104 RepID=A0A1G9ME42_9PSEU|nr:class I SAM-dependent methyltransferase [Lentzea albidocapillata]SDL72526.1 Methyltransferase domain-containing protein [Lentzea albidocapillata subsp. violacea]